MVIGNARQRRWSLWSVSERSAIMLLIVALTSGCSYAVIGAGTADFASTRYAIAKGAKEGNVLMGQGALRQALVKAGGISGVLGLSAWADHKGKPTLSEIVKASAVIVWSGASAWNVYRASARSGR